MFEVDLSVPRTARSWALYSKSYLSRSAKMSRHRCEAFAASERDQLSLLLFTCKNRRLGHHSSVRRVLVQVLDCLWVLS